MIRIRPAAERGHFDHGWLKTWHSFAFAEYRDPEHMGFGPLRVINQDIIGAGQGFGTHPHRDMEIITYVLEGALAHRDSEGNEGVIRPGMVQRMSAGTGILHSEYNHSADEPAHLLQIWIVPESRGHTPRYEDRDFSTLDNANRLRLLVSPDGVDGSLDIHQDARLFDARLATGRTVAHEFAAGRRGWLQLIDGEIELNGLKLSAGDGAAIQEEAALTIRSARDAQLLLFDLP